MVHRESAPPSRARKACSAVATGGVHPHRASLSGWASDIRPAAVCFPDRRIGRFFLASSGRFTRQPDFLDNKRARGWDRRDAAPCIVDGAALPLCGNCGIRPAPVACRNPTLGSLLIVVTGRRSSGYARFRLIGRSFKRRRIARRTPLEGGAFHFKGFKVGATGVVIPAQDGAHA